MSDHPALSENWRLLPYSDAASAAWQLAAANALLDSLTPTAQPALRWYAARQPALILGAGQKPDAINHAECAAAGVTIHKRASGGTAVLFEPGLLMQDIALPAAHRLWIADVTESYRWLGGVWIEALRLLGVNARLIDVAEARTDAQALDSLAKRACFGGRSPYEVLVGGRKIVGFAQVRRRMGVLLQVGIYTHWSPELLARLLTTDAAERAAIEDALAERIAGLSDVLITPPSFDAIEDAFAAALRAIQGVALAPSTWNATEQQAIQTLLERFAPQA